MGSTLDLIRSVWDLGEKSKDAALKQAFVDLRLRVTELQEENGDRREQIMKLKEQLQKQEAKFEWDGKFYWDRSAPEGPAQGPFCQKCRDDDKKDVRLHEETYGFRCKVCKHFYRTKDAPPDPPRPPPEKWVRYR
jgi:hypothetical protein